MDITITIPDTFFEELVKDGMRSEATAVGRRNIIRDAIIQALNDNPQKVRTALSKGVNLALADNDFLEDLGKKAVNEKFRK